MQSGTIGHEHEHHNDDGPLFPAKAAFIVHLTRDAIAAGDPRGRVEHIDSGQAAKFSSPQELMEFMANTLRKAADVSQNL